MTWCWNIFCKKGSSVLSFSQPPVAAVATFYHSDSHGGFTRERYAQRFLAAMAVSDLQKTLLPSLSMGAAFYELRFQFLKAIAGTNRCAYRSRVNPPSETIAIVLNQTLALTRKYKISEKKEIFTAVQIVYQCFLLSICNLRKYKSFFAKAKI